MTNGKATFLPWVSLVAPAFREPEVSTETPPGPSWVQPVPPLQPLPSGKNPRTASLGRTLILALRTAPGSRTACWATLGLVRRHGHTPRQSTQARSACTYTMPQMYLHPHSNIHTHVQAHTAHTCTPCPCTYMHLHTDTHEVHMLTLLQNDY